MNLLEYYPSKGKGEALADIKRELRQMIEEGVLRLHWGPMCTGDERASSAQTVPSTEVEFLPDSAFEPYMEPSVYVCDTPRTMDAYKQAWQQIHESKNES